MTLDDLLHDLKALRATYDTGANPLTGIGALGKRSLDLLNSVGTRVRQGTLQSRAAGGVTHAARHYEVYAKRPGVVAEGERTRPILPSLLIDDPNTFERKWNSVAGAIRRGSCVLTHPDSEAVVYTCTQAFAGCIDILRPGSRKTPGTFFEVIIGSLLGELTARRRGKQIPIPETGEFIPTDIVLYSEGRNPSLVVPTKTSTRERVVQPFVHQLICERLLPGGYISILLVVSEVQRVGTDAVKETCVPRQLEHFQKQLAPIAGFYYLDPPITYLCRGDSALLTIRSFGDLLRTDLTQLVSYTPAVTPAPVAPAGPRLHRVVRTRRRPSQ